MKKLHEALQQVQLKIVEQKRTNQEQKPNL